MARLNPDPDADPNPNPNPNPNPGPGVVELRGCGSRLDALVSAGAIELPVSSEMAHGVGRIRCGLDRPHAGLKIDAMVRALGLEIPETCRVSTPIKEGSLRGLVEKVHIFHCFGLLVLLYRTMAWPSLGLPEVS